MFDRLKKAFLRESPKPAEQDGAAAPRGHGPVSEWAASQGFSLSVMGDGQTLALQGHVGGKPWRMELGRPTRRYIHGEELRARAELGLPENLAIMMMNRPLKESLATRAYSMFTDSLQTTADPNLPEEMRWLAIYEEVGWAGMPEPFWDRYAVLADDREHATAWIDAPLAKLLLDWPPPAPPPEVPFMMLILRGKAYLRMEHRPGDMATLQHAARVFTSACDAALGGLRALKPRE